VQRAQVGRALGAVSWAGLGCGLLLDGDLAGWVTASSVAAAVLAAALNPSRAAMTLLIAAFLASRAMPHFLADTFLAVRDAPTHLEGVTQGILDEGRLRPHASGYHQYPVIHLLLAMWTVAGGMQLFAGSVVLALTISVALQVAVGSMTRSQYGTAPVYGMAAFVLMVHGAQIQTLYQPMTVAILFVLLLLWSMESRGDRWYAVGLLVGAMLALTHLYTSVAALVLLLVAFVLRPIANALLQRRGPKHVHNPALRWSLALPFAFGVFVLFYNALLTGQDAYVARLFAPLFGTEVGGYTGEEVAEDFATTSGSRFFRVFSNVSNLFVPAVTLFGIWYVWTRRDGLRAHEAFAFVDRGLAYLSGVYAALLPSRLLAIGAPAWSTLGGPLLRHLAGMRRPGIALGVLAVAATFALTGYDALNHSSLWHGREPFPRPYAQPAVDLGQPLGAWAPSLDTRIHLTEHTRTPLPEDLQLAAWHWPPRSNGTSLWILDATSLVAPVELSSGFGEPPPAGSRPLVLPTQDEVKVMDQQTRFLDFGSHWGWSLRG
jgi:hypothetical protein